MTQVHMKRHRALVAGALLAAFTAGGLTGWAMARWPDRPSPATSPSDEAGPVELPPDPLYRGRPLDHWRVLIKTGGFGFSGWGASVTLFDGPAEVVLSAVDGSGRELFPLMAALAWDPDPVIRRTAARGLATFGKGPTEAAALDGLRRLLRDPDQCVRREAAGSLDLGGWATLTEEDRHRLTDPILHPRRGEPEYGAMDDGCDEGGRVSAAELAHLADHPRLTRLRLGPDVTDPDLARVGRMGRLMFLDLDGTRVTDAGLEHLGGLSGLVHLDLTGTAVTLEGVARLRSSLPRVRITR